MRIIFIKGVYELPDDPGEEAEEGGHVEDEVEEEGRHVEGWIHPVPGKVFPEPYLAYSPTSSTLTSSSIVRCAALYFFMICIVDSRSQQSS